MSYTDDVLARVEIARLRAENERLREALRAAVDEYDCQTYGPRIFAIEEARAALKEDT